MGYSSLEKQRKDKAKITERVKVSNEKNKEKINVSVKELREGRNVVISNDTGLNPWNDPESLFYDDESAKRTLELYRMGSNEEN